jgi:hypothetical protein
MDNFFSTLTSWEFLDEPLWRWALFFGAMLGIAWGWNGVLDLMK